MRTPRSSSTNQVPKKSNSFGLGLASSTEATVPDLQGGKDPLNASVSIHNFLVFQ